MFTHGQLFQLREAAAGELLFVTKARSLIAETISVSHFCKEIEDILLTEHNMTVERKAIKRNLMKLIDFGYAQAVKQNNTGVS